MEKNKIIEEYLEYLKYKNYSKLTISEYIINLKIFFEFMIYYYNWNVAIEDINIFLLNQIDKYAILAFIKDLRESRNIESCTVNRYIASVKNFLKWLYIQSEYSKDILKDKDNPAKVLYYGRKVQKLPKYLEQKAAMDIQAIFTEENSNDPIRNNTIIVMFLTTGIRLNELYRLNINDIDFDKKQGKVIRKGNKEQTIYLSSKTVQSLKEYLKTRQDECEALFVNYRGTRLSKRSIERICEKAFELCGLADKKYTAHTLRHTAATYIYKETKDILIVQEFLGHDNIKASEIYTHLVNEDAEKAINKHPLASYCSKNMKRKGNRA